MDAHPYNYSDMTGFNNQFVNAGRLPLKGYWAVIHDSHPLGLVWQRVAWNAVVTSGALVEVFARASDNSQALANETFAPVTNDLALAGLKGQFIELRLALIRPDATTNSSVKDISLYGTSTGFAELQGPSDLTVSNGGDAVFRTGVVGVSPLSYQRYVKYPGGNYSPVGTGPVLTLSNVTYGTRNGTLVKVQVSNGLGESAWLGPATLTVLPP